ncbi:MAG: hypothetical protein JOZ39_12015 [Chloroflexi bacterium]|nr:hypothetical protein [Chloroflexota bacterium]
MSTQVTRRQVLVAASALPFLGLLAACGGGAAPPGSPSGLGGQGGTLTLSSGVIEPQIDLALRTANPPLIYQRQIGDSLTMTDDAGGVKPQLADSWKNVDPTTWEFKLKPNIKFSNGKAFGGEDVKWSVDRILDPANKFGTILGNIGTIAEVQVVDATTVRFKTKAPDPIIDRRLSSVMIMPAGITMDQAATKPIGTGPWQVDDFQPSQSLTLVPFNDSWRGKPKLSKLVAKSIVDDGARLGALQSGELDFATAISPDKVDGLKQAGFQILSTTIAAGPAIFLDAKLPQWADTRLRQAMNYAVDKQSIVQNIWRGFTEPSSQIISKYAFGFNPDLQPYPYDPNKAKSLLDQVGLPANFSTTVLTPVNVLNMKEAAEAAVGFLNQVGIKANLQIIEFGNWATGFSAGTLTPAFMAASPYYPTLDASIPLIAFSSSDPLHRTFYKNPQYDDLMKQQATELDTNKRRSLLQQALKVAHDDPPTVLLVQQADIYAASSKLKGLFKPAPNQVNWFDTTSKEG